MNDSTFLVSKIRKQEGWRSILFATTAVVICALVLVSNTSQSVKLAQVSNRQARLQSLYEDKPYDVDPVISSDSYIPKFKDPEARNSIYEGVETEPFAPSIYESGPHIDEITDSSFSAPEERNPVYQGVYSGYEAAEKASPQMLYEDRPYDVDPVISADSYIPKFKAPEERNDIYQGTYAGYQAAEKATRSQMLYEDRPYDVDPVISADSYIPKFKAPEERNDIYQGTYAGYEAVN